MNCKNTETDSLSYIERKLTDNKIVELYEHLQECESCRDGFIMNYAIYTAISQLEHGEDFSDNYRLEAEQHLRSDYQRIVRKRHLTRFYRFVVLVLLVGTGIFLGITTSNSYLPNHLPEGQESSFRLEYYGIPEEFDPVEHAIKEYNSEMIQQIREHHTGE